MNYLFAAVIGYLMGCSNLTFFLGKAKGIDPRKNGSGNLGASNAAVLMGWGAAVAVAFHDGAKATLATWLCQFLFPGTAHVGAVAGVSAVMGHIFPFYLGFKGGKGFASYIGTIMMLDLKFALIIIAAVVLVTVLSDFIVAGTTLTIVASPIYFGIKTGSWILAVILSVATVVMICKHRANYVRIFRGQELGLRGAIRGDNRVKK